MLGDTIAAISTAIGEAGIGIVRVSGSEALEITKSIFLPKSPARFAEAKGYRLYYGHIVDHVSGDLVEEVLVSIMLEPHSFTGENVVEINCHGGFVAQQSILRLLLVAGARLAEPGEFTKRAFINGRLDLAQAEAVIDLIRAKTHSGVSSALEQLQGKLSTRINECRLLLLEVIAQIEAGIDFPEEDLDLDTPAILAQKLKSVLELGNDLLLQAQKGKILREGISTAIIGQPNVGKSSLLNALLREDRAIVTEIPGTTRDVLEEYINVRGIPLKLIDTAGIRETEDLIEKIGVDRALQVLNQADLVLFVIEAGRDLTAEERSLLDNIPADRMVVVVNKIDLGESGNELDFKVPIFYVSALKHQGIDNLEDGLAELLTGNSVQKTPIISNVRHISALEKAVAKIEDAVQSLSDQVPLDLVSIDIRGAWILLGEITGQSVNEDLLDEIFSRFCIGK